MPGFSPAFLFFLCVTSGLICTAYAVKIESPTERLCPSCQRFGFASTTEPTTHTGLCENCPFGASLVSGEPEPSTLGRPQTRAPDTRDCIPNIDSPERREPTACPKKRLNPARSTT